MIFFSVCIIPFHLFNLNIFLGPRIERLGAYCFTFVCLSVHLSAQTEHENLTFSHYSETNLVTRLIFGMKAHLIDTHLLVPRSKSSAKVKVKYQGHVSQRGCFGGISVSQTHFVFSVCIIPFQFIWFKHIFLLGLRSKFFQFIFAILLSGNFTSNCAKCLGQLFFAFMLY